MTRLSTPLVVACIILGLPINGFVLPFQRSQHALQDSKSHNQPLIFSPSTGEVLETRPLHGRFLEITDIHPDPNYKPFTDPDSCCHYGNNEDYEFSPEDTGHYGFPVSKCDAPPSLVNATFEWIQKHYLDNIDFIVWTGDNVRHDRDRLLPRTEPEIFSSNEELVSTFRNVFGTGNPYFPYRIPIIPNIGNNDVYPHNLVVEGPTLQSREFYRIYNGMVPEEQAHIFNKGMYFMKEVIPNQLVVISLNTLYWFDTNPVVDGCNIKTDPGSHQFRWLRVVLKELRARGMKAWLSGHVPPTKDNWEPTCRDRYIAWTHEYRDVIIGGLYGHMNIDHFVVHDIVEAYKQKKEEGVAATHDESFVEPSLLSHAEASEDFDQDDHIKTCKPKHYIDPSDHDSFTAQGKADYFEEIRLGYEKAAKNHNNDTRYSLSLVHPSVIPTYFPGVRVYEYNIEGLDEAVRRPQVYANGLPVRPWSDIFDELNEYLDLIKQLDNSELDELDIETHGLEMPEVLHITKKKGKDKKKKKKKKLIIDPTWPPEFGDIEPGPAYKYQLFTPTKYIQFIANISRVNLKGEKFYYEVEYDTNKAPYHMVDLTVKNWIYLAGNLSSSVVQKKKKKGLWDKYLFYAFESSGYEEIMTWIWVDS